MFADQKTVALVGRPNVGKSRLFNRLARRRISIVHDQPGVTRDLVAADMPGGWTLLDTGGIGLTGDLAPQAILAAAEQQVDLAIQAATILVLVIDGRAGVTPLDEQIAGLLRKRGKRPLLAVNKVDDPAQEELLDFGPLLKLGFGDPLLVSAEHRRNVTLLEERLHRELGLVKASVPEAAGERRIRICFAGRPNVGKSSLGNALLQAPRLVVSEIPGTTRDAVEMNLDLQATPGEAPQRFRLVDTAGLRSKGKVDSSVEYFSTVRARRAMDRSDVVFLVLDAREGITRTDQRLAGELIEEGKAVVILVNKWDFAIEALGRGELDGYEDEREFRKSYVKALEKELFFLPDSPVLFVSAKSGEGIGRILPAATLLDQRMEKPLTTSALNQSIQELLAANPPRRVQSKRFKVFYAVQVGSRPFRVRLFANQEFRLEATYLRYLQKGISGTFGVSGCPIDFEIVGKESRYANPSTPVERKA